MQFAALIDDFQNTPAEQHLIKLGFLADFVEAGQIDVNDFHVDEEFARSQTHIIIDFPGGLENGVDRFQRASDSHCFKSVHSDVPPLCRAHGSILCAIFPSISIQMISGYVNLFCVLWRYRQNTAAAAVVSLLLPPLWGVISACTP